MSAYWTILTFFILGVSKLTMSLDTKGSTYCEFYDQITCSDPEQDCPKMEECVADHPEARNHCFVSWHFNKITNKTTVKQKGCFLDGAECYDKTECIDQTGGRRGNLFFCCCSGDMCNLNFTWIPKTTQPPQVIETTVAPQLKTQDKMNFSIILSVTVSAIILIVLGMTMWCLKRRNSKKYTDPESTPESKSSPNPQLGPIQLLEMKARGNFGAVWKAKMGNDIVAAKIFSIQQEQSWQTEQDVFKLPHMSHRNLLDFIGVEKKEDNLQTELWLITAYHEKGSLCDYLRINVLTWSQMCKIAESMLRGLMHLHDEIPANKIAGCKPAVAHRDFKSQNILLKADMSACIADFGLSLIFHPAKPIGNTHGQVGTRRYMAPEVLQGAINFNRDSFLRIDMYACGLVLWELASRCSVQDVTVKKYRLPFEEEVGLYPSLADMLRVVMHQDGRPQILTSWRNHPDLSSFCDIMEECWDIDPEARLSASCVLERMLRFTRSE